MHNKMSGYSDKVPSAKDAKDTKQLDTTAREMFQKAEGSNQKAHTVKHKAFGEGGARGRS